MTCFRYLIAVGLGLLVVGLVQATAGAKGPVDRIDLSRLEFAHTLIVLDDAVLLEFNPWAQAFLGGRLAARPAAVGEVVTVTLYLNDNSGSPQPIYRFAYYPGSEGGTIYLPGPGDPDYDLNKATILDGSGRWYQASAAWEVFFETVERIWPPATGNGGLRQSQAIAQEFHSFQV